jgi:hypothetical protein
MQATKIFLVVLYIDAFTFAISRRLGRIMSLLRRLLAAWKSALAITKGRWTANLRAPKLIERVSPPLTIRG